MFSARTLDRYDINRAASAWPRAGPEATVQPRNGLVVREISVKEEYARCREHGGVVFIQVNRPPPTGLKALRVSFLFCRDLLAYWAVAAAR